MPAPLPLELYTNIIRFLTTNSDIRAICLVSHALLHEARRWLYRTPTISSIRFIPRFARTVVNRPHIASLVRELTLKFPLYFDGIHNEAGVNIVHAMMQALPALRRLSVNQLDPHVLAGLLAGSVSHLDMLSARGGVRRLSPGLQELVVVLGASQPDLKEWVYEPQGEMSPEIVVAFPESTFLPRLNVLSVPAIVLHSAPYQQWSLTRLNLNLTAYGAERETVLGEVLVYFRPTLVSLSLVRRRMNNFPVMAITPMLALVAHIATSITELRFLSLTDYVIPNDTEIAELENSGWSALKHLRAIAWWSEDFDPKWDPFDEDPPLRPEDDSRISSLFATKLVKVCPSVERFVFVSSKDDEGFKWSKGVRERFLWRRVEVDQDYTSTLAWMWA